MNIVHIKLLNKVHVKSFSKSSPADMEIKFILHSTNNYKKFRIEYNEQHSTTLPMCDYRKS